MADFGEKICNIISLWEKSLECAICLEPINEPVGTTCNHDFCRECILKTIATDFKRCPLCKQKISKRGLKDKHKLKKIMSISRDLLRSVRSDFCLEATPILKCQYGQLQNLKNFRKNTTVQKRGESTGDSMHNIIECDSTMDKNKDNIYDNVIDITDDNEKNIYDNPWSSDNSRKEVCENKNEKMMKEDAKEMQQDDNLVRERNSIRDVLHGNDTLLTVSNNCIESKQFLSTGRPSLHSSETIGHELHNQTKVQEHEEIPKHDGNKLSVSSSEMTGLEKDNERTYSESVQHSHLKNLKLQQMHQSDLSDYSCRVNVNDDINIFPSEIKDHSSEEFCNVKEFGKTVSSELSRNEIAKNKQQNEACKKRKRNLTSDEGTEIQRSKCKYAEGRREAYSDAGNAEEKIVRRVSSAELKDCKAFDALSHTESCDDSDMLLFLTPQGRNLSNVNKSGCAKYSSIRKSEKAKKIRIQSWKSKKRELDKNKAWERTSLRDMELYNQNVESAKEHELTIEDSTTNNSTHQAKNEDLQKKVIVSVDVIPNQPVSHTLSSLQMGTEPFSHKDVNELSNNIECSATLATDDVNMTASLQKICIESNNEDSFLNNLDKNSRKTFAINIDTQDLFALANQTTDLVDKIETTLSCSNNKNENMECDGLPKTKSKDALIAAEAISNKNVQDILEPAVVPSYISDDNDSKDVSASASVEEIKSSDIDICTPQSKSFSQCNDETLRSKDISRDSNRHLQDHSTSMKAVMTKEIAVQTEEISCLCSCFNCRCCTWKSHSHTLQIQLLKSKSNDEELQMPAIRDDYNKSSVNKKDETQSRTFVRHIDAMKNTKEIDMSSSESDSKKKFSDDLFSHYDFSLSSSFWDSKRSKSSKELLSQVCLRDGIDNTRQERGSIYNDTGNAYNQHTEITNSKDVSHADKINTQPCDTIQNDELLDEKTIVLSPACKVTSHSCSFTSQVFLSHSQTDQIPGSANGMQNDQDKICEDDFVPPTPPSNALVNASVCTHKNNVTGKKDFINMMSSQKDFTICAQQEKTRNKTVCRLSQEEIWSILSQNKAACNSEVTNELQQNEGDMEITNLLSPCLISDNSTHEQDLQYSLDLSENTSMANVLKNVASDLKLAGIDMDIDTNRCVLSDEENCHKQDIYEEHPLTEGEMELVACNKTENVVNFDGSILNEDELSGRSNLNPQTMLDDETLQHNRREVTKNLNPAEAGNSIKALVNESSQLLDEAVLAENERLTEAFATSFESCINHKDFSDNRSFLVQDVPSLIGQESNTNTEYELKDTQSHIVVKQKIEDMEEQLSRYKELMKKKEILHVHDELSDASVKELQDMNEFAASVEKRESKKRLSLVTTRLTAANVARVKMFCSFFQADFRSAFHSSTTHVVVETDGNRVCEQTLKYVQGIASKKWIVSLRWIETCLERRNLLPEDDYEVLGDVNCGVNHAPRLSRKADQLLLKNYEICCMGPFSSLSREDLIQLIEVCGGLAVFDPSMFSYSSKRQLIVVEGKKHVQEVFRHYNATCIVKDWVLDSISQFTCLPLDQYALSLPVTTRR